MRTVVVGSDVFENHGARLGQDWQREGGAAWGRRSAAVGCNRSAATRRRQQSGLYVTGYAVCRAILSRQAAAHRTRLSGPIG